MDYIWTDWQHALDGLKQLHFIGRLEFSLNLFQWDSQNISNDNPLEKLKKVKLNNISSEIDDQTIVPWINKFLNKDYMPSLQIFHFIKNNNSQITINQELFQRSDIQINII
jgi:hypothetical protein